MKKTWVLVTVFPFLLLGAVGNAGPLDQLKNFRLDPKSIARPKQTAVEFQFSNFKLKPDSGRDSRTWTVDLRITESIENAYLVRTVFQNRGGEVLFSGDDINLPAGNAGKTYHLTRQFQKSPDVSAIVFEVFSQAENRAVASQSFPLSAVSSYDMQGATSSSQPNVPQRVPDRNANLNTDIEYSLIFMSAQEKFQIQNNSAYPLKVSEMTAKARFLVGIDEDIPVRCDPKEIQPGRSVVCEYSNVPMSCATLAGIDFRFKLNGVVYQEELKFDAPAIRKISSEPVIRIEKAKSTGGRSDMKGSGIAHVTVRGSYVKQGAKLTMKAFVSVDSDMFPVVFVGRQEDDGIHAQIEVVGSRDTVAPDKFCFRLAEITTDDMCGGAGALLYRNPFNKDELKYSQPSGREANYFLNNAHCK
ncbi:MAG: hypothetical protein WC029_12510 [Sulfuricella sp.]|jgi:hypothetical protein